MADIALQRTAANLGCTCIVTQPSSWFPQHPVLSPALCIMQKSSAREVVPRPASYISHFDPVPQSNSISVFEIIGYHPMSGGTQAKSHGGRLKAASPGGQPWACLGGRDASRAGVSGSVSSWSWTSVPVADQHCWDMECSTAGCRQISLTWVFLFPESKGPVLARSMTANVRRKLLQ